MSDGKEHDVQAGCIVLIPGDCEQGIRNEANEELRWFYVSPTGSFDDVVNRFSEDIGVRNPVADP